MSVEGVQSRNYRLSSQTSPEVIFLPPLSCWLLAINKTFSNSSASLPHFMVSRVAEGRDSSLMLYDAQSF